MYNYAKLYLGIKIIDIFYKIKDIGRGKNNPLKLLFLNPYLKEKVRPDKV
jgi:hypothetical protein